MSHTRAIPETKTKHGYQSRRCCRFRPNWDFVGLVFIDYDTGTAQSGYRCCVCGGEWATPPEMFAPGAPNGLRKHSSCLMARSGVLVKNRWAKELNQEVE